MAKARKQKKRSINPWTAADLKSLRKQAGRVSAAKIAKAVKRSEGAVRQKAGSLRISLRLR
jgi:predicted transcriptional regulator